MSIDLQKNWHKNQQKLFGICKLHPFIHPSVLYHCLTCTLDSVLADFAQIQRCSLDKPLVRHHQGWRTNKHSLTENNLRDKHVKK